MKNSQIISKLKDFVRDYSHRGFACGFFSEDESLMISARKDKNVNSLLISKTEFDIKIIKFEKEIEMYLYVLSYLNIQDFETKKEIILCSL